MYVYVHMYVYDLQPSCLHLVVLSTCLIILHQLYVYIYIYPEYTLELFMRINFDDQSLEVPSREIHMFPTSSQGTNGEGASDGYQSLMKVQPRHSCLLESPVR